MPSVLLRARSHHMNVCLAPPAAAPVPTNNSLSNTHSSTITTTTTISGVAHRYFGTAVGKGRQSVKTEIERLKLDQMTCRQAVVEAAKV